jgi:hypothetical protein
MNKLTERLAHQIVENNQRGTIDYFCDLLKTDDYDGVTFAMAELEDKDTTELIGTKTSYGGDGLPVIQGVFGIAPEALADNIIEKLRKTNITHQDGIDYKKLEDAYKELRVSIISKVREARQRNR